MTGLCRFGKKIEEISNLDLQSTRQIQFPFLQRGMYFFRSILFSVILLISFFVSCRTSIPPEIQIAEIRKDFNVDNLPVVLVPGIKGSILKDNKGDIRWLTGFQSLNFSTPELRLYGESYDLIPSGAIPRVTAIPYILDVAIYSPFLESMSQEKDIDFYVFSYDWRKDNLINRDRLISFLESLNQKYKKKPILVGHSMGGMISLSIENSKPNLVDKVIYVGTPFRGGIGFMDDLMLGVDTGLNSEIVSPCVLAKFRSVYGFFPRLNTADSKNTILDEQGKSLSVDFFSAKDWHDHSLGHYSINCKPDDLPNPIAFQDILNRAKLFRKSLDPSKPINSTNRRLVISAKNRSTMRSMVRLSKAEMGKGSEWKFDSSPKVPGDGSVCYEDSLPPDGIKYDSLETEYEHSALLNDPKVISGILEFIRK
ncbi:lipase/acyltransferase domain-containing protein [Leptospira sp. GIMC2001]|uniref:lipase/acyltransferase domain-containing protein n=1 Tax=Leptospira sp. GIMC2001 TaxID=1513297 RepID=UPI00234B0EE5|nr:lecithin--cholesterol acyltransferase [Leptospira sp. GIMC2001]WCL49261.1 lecithin--cholesterol acyltransferase [Leptospira sp. GIMC2001]